MSEEKRADDELTFGEKLLGMQGFNAARAERYRAEISKLVTHRVSSFERWALGAFGVVFMGLLLVLGITMTTSRDKPAFEGFDLARWTLSAACVATGVLLGGWMLWVAKKGGYRRRAGDLIGAIIALAFGGGAGIAFVEAAWATDNSVTRAKTLFAGEVFLALVLACLLITFLQRMHRRTDERLLRIEYHLAELMERNAGSSST